MSAESQSEMLTVVPMDLGPLGSEVVAGLHTTVGRAQTMAGIAEKIEQQSSIPRLREEGNAPTLTPTPPSAAQKPEDARHTRGQLVEVRSAREIVATLDTAGKLDGIPFMPEMAVYCGRSFRVYRRADITCVEGHGMRRMDDTVFLEDVRCDGSAHDGCQRRCLIFWKEAWLKPADHSPLMADKESEREAVAVLVNLPTREQNRYLCQSTALATATANLPGWNLLPYLRQVRDGELNVTRFLQIIALVLVNLLRRFLGFNEIGRLTGLKSQSSKTNLALQHGEWVRIKSSAEIRQTLDSEGRNRGLKFEPEMSESCGKLFQMDVPVKKMIREETGEMINVKNTVTLKGLTCHGLCAKSCPRNNYWYWREDWLERVPNTRRA
jgi:hypothetical protein